MSRSSLAGIEVFLTIGITKEWRKYPIERTPANGTGFLFTKGIDRG